MGVAWEMRVGVQCLGNEGKESTRSSRSVPCGALLGRVAKTELSHQTALS